MTIPRRTALTLAGVGPLMLAACGNGNGTDSAGGGPLTFANWQWLEPNRGEAIWAAVTSSDDTSATLEQQEITRADYENTLQTQLGAGDGPDLLVVPITFFPMLTEANLLEPLDGLLDDEQIGRLNATNEDAVVDGSQLAYTWEVVNYAFFWNQALLDEAQIEPPTTPKELITAAIAVQDATGATGFGVRHQMNEETAWWTDFGAWIYGFDGAWSDGASLTINSEENISAVQAYKDVYDSGAFAVGDDASTMRSSFAQGQLAMMIDNSAAVTAMISDDGAVKSTDIVASDLPFPGSQTVRDHAYIAINGNSENKDAAKEWLKWLFTEGAQAEVHAAMGASALGADSTPPAEYIDANPWVQTYLDQTDKSQSAMIEGFEAETPSIRTIILDHITRILTQDVPVDEALTQAHEDVSAAIE